MNSSAKTTAFSFLAAAALGAVVFMGCKVGSDVDDDTDGDENTPRQDAGDDTDANADAGDQTPVCQSGQNEFDGGAFQFPGQECLDQNCCTELTSCFAIQATEDKINCYDYSDCIDKCGTDEDICSACDDAAAPGVIDAYNAIATCSTTNTCGQ